MNPNYDNRSPSPGRPLQGYQLDDAPYMSQEDRVPEGSLQPLQLQMPMASSDRLAVQPTVCAKAQLNKMKADIGRSTPSRIYKVHTGTTRRTMRNIL